MKTPMPGGMKTARLKRCMKINPLRISYIEQFAQLSDSNIIDVGCGGGLLSEAMALKGAKVTAIDLSDVAIETAKQHAKTSQVNIDYQLIDAESIAATNSGQFDIVTCMEMLEHVPDPASIINACAQLCRTNGKIFFSTINRNLKSFLMMIVGAEYIANLIPKGTHHYEKFIKPSELNNWSSDAGLVLQDLKGLRYNPITHEHKICDDVDVNFMMCLSKK